MIVSTGTAVGIEKGVYPAFGIEVGTNTYEASSSSMRVLSLSSSSLELDPLESDVSSSADDDDVDEEDPWKTCPRRL
jgi:hypothetical protein